MLSFRLFLVFLLAGATLLLSFRAPAAPTMRQILVPFSTLLHDFEQAPEDCSDAEERSSTSQQGPLEEIHDLSCSVDRQQFLFWLQDDSSCSGLHPLLWMRIPLMSCFQPPERG